jgi:hypothetical protein
MLLPATVPCTALNPQSLPTMIPFLTVLLPIAAAGYSLIYLILGGGFFGAVVIFIIAKMFGK